MINMFEYDINASWSEKYNSWVRIEKIRNEEFKMVGFSTREEALKKDIVEKKLFDENNMPMFLSEK
jgi:hypothetical protein